MRGYLLELYMMLVVKRRLGFQSLAVHCASSWDTYFGCHNRNNFVLLPLMFGLPFFNFMLRADPRPRSKGRRTECVTHVREVGLGSVERCPHARLEPIKN